MDTCNHCLCFLELLKLPEGLLSGALLITPLLHNFNKPEFDTVGKFLDFVQQLLEVRFFVDVL
jgi:hypothetical protein